MELFFWIAATIIAYTYLGYAILLYVLVCLKRIICKAEKHEVVDTPPITLLIAAYNEADIIAAKMANTRKLDYPNLEILWVTDGSTDESNKLLATYPDVRVCFSSERRGKTAALNHGMQAVKTPLVVFTDANTMLNETAIDEINRCFADPEVGCVSGEKRIATNERDSASGGGEGIYWLYESKLKAWDSALYSATGAAGELFAVRTELFEAMPEDTLLDDFILSMRIAIKGYKISYCKEAYAVESGSEDMAHESTRKVRIAAGGLQSIARLLPLWNIFKFPVFSFQYISHRVLRWSLTPVLLFLLFPLNAYLAVSSSYPALYQGLFALQVVFYTAAALGFYYQNRKIKVKLFFIPMYFVFMNWNVLRAVPYLMKNRGKGAWEKAKRSNQPI